MEDTTTTSTTQEQGKDGWTGTVAAPAPTMEPVSREQGKDAAQAARDHGKQDARKLDSVLTAELDTALAAAKENKASKPIARVAQSAADKAILASLQGKGTSTGASKGKAPAKRATGASKGKASKGKASKAPAKGAERTTAVFDAKKAMEGAGPVTRWGLQFFMEHGGKAGCYSTRKLASYRMADGILAAFKAGKYAFEVAGTNAVPESLSSVRTDAKWLGATGAFEGRPGPVWMDADQLSKFFTPRATVEAQRAEAAAKQEQRAAKRAAREAKREASQAPVAKEQEAKAS